MKAEDLSDLDPFGILDAEAERLDRRFSGLGAAQWAAPSACAGWSVRDVLGHLAGEELYNHACLNGDVAGFFRMLEREGVGGGFSGFNDWCVEQRRDLPVSDVLAEWREANAETRSRMRELGRNTTLETSAGPYPVGLQTLHYASEHATHADDVAAPVRAHEAPGRTAWRARFGRFALAERHSAAEVEPLDGRYRVLAGNVTAELSEPDFVTATVARLPVDHPLDPVLRDALRCLA